VLLVCSPRACGAMWAYVSLDELVQRSDLIVIGALGEVRWRSEGGWDRGAGVITVSEVIWGDVAPGEKLELRWRDRTNVACPRLDLQRLGGRRQLWLLQVGDGATVRADHPGRVLDPNEAETVRRSLVEHPVALRGSSYLVHLGGAEPMQVSVRFRNPGELEILFPGIAVRDSVLVVDPRLSLDFSYQRLDGRGFVPIRARPGLVTQDSLEVRIAPRAEYVVSFDLRDIVDIDSMGFYAVECKPATSNPSNTVRFMVR